VSYDEYDDDYFNEDRVAIKDIALRMARGTLDAPTEEKFLSTVARMERQHISCVQDNINHCDFPPDLRERAKYAIDHLATDGPGRQQAADTRTSALLRELQEIFRELRERRVEAAFGIWSENPGRNRQLMSKGDISD
jgi:hypothetical protein